MGPAGRQETYDRRESICLRTSGNLSAVEQAQELIGLTKLVTDHKGDLGSLALHTEPLAASAHWRGEITTLLSARAQNVVFSFGRGTGISSSVSLEVQMRCKGRFPGDIETDRYRGSGKVVARQEQPGLALMGTPQILDQPPVPDAVLGQADRPMARLGHSGFAHGAD